MLIIFFYHLFNALQITTAFVLRAYKVTLVPTIIYARLRCGASGWAAAICLASMSAARFLNGCKARAASGSAIP